MSIVLRASAPPRASMTTSRGEDEDGGAGDGGGQSVPSCRRCKYQPRYRGARAQSRNCNAAVQWDHTTAKKRPSGPTPPFLGPRIQRNSKAESLLPGCALSPLKCPSNFPRRRLLPSERFQFANVCSSPFTSLRILGHVASDLKASVITKPDDYAELCV